MPVQFIPDAGAGAKDGGTPADSGIAQAPGEGCHADGDCLLVRTPAGSCCETLCSPRSVLKTDAKLIHDLDACKNADLKKCEMPNCAPPRGGEPVAVCKKNHCVIERVNND